MPEYFCALIKQYCGAVGNEQAERIAASVAKAWYHSLPASQRTELVQTLPEYLRPKSRLFFDRVKFELNTPQAKLVTSRIQAELQKTDAVEVEYLLAGFFKSLKIISEPKQKFAYSKLLDKKLLETFIQA